MASGAPLRSALSRATACARRASSTRLPSPRPRSRRSICRPGTASRTIAFRPTPRVGAQRMTVLARLAQDPRRRGAAAHSRGLGQRADAARAAARVRRLGRFLRRARQQRADGGPRALARGEWLRARQHGARRRRLRLARRHSRSLSAGRATPIRLDFFGDTLESIRAFDPETQRSTTQLRSLDLVPMSEARLTTDSIQRFRQGYAAEFGAPAPSDDLYDAVSEGSRAIGVEHWLPLLYDKLDTIFDYVDGAPFVLDARAEDAADERIALIADYYAARRAAYVEAPGKSDYRPLPADSALSQRRRMAGAARRAAAGAPDALRRAVRTQPTSSIAADGRDAISLPSGRTRASTCSTPRSRTSGRCASAA